MLYQILPKKEYLFEAEKMIMFFKTIASNKSKFSWKSLFNGFDLQYIIECDKDNKIAFYIYISDAINQDLILNALQVLFANKAVVFEAKNQLSKHTTVNTLYIQENYQKSSNGIKQQLTSFTNDAIFMNILGMMLPNTRITIDFRIDKASASENSAFKHFSRITNDVVLELWIRVSGSTKFSRNNVMQLSESICSLTAANSKLWIKFKDKYLPIKLLGSEAINLLQLPTLFRKENDVISRIYHLLRGQQTLDEKQFAEGIYVGKLNHPIQKDRKVYISWSHARKHGIISGTTGSGKSSADEEITEDILRHKLTDINSAGFTLFDPLETSVLGVIDKILKLESEGNDITELLKRVHYIDFSTDEYIFPITLLNPKIDVTETLDFFKSLYGDTNTIQVDRMLSTAIKCLLLDTKEHSIFDVEKIFQDENFREVLIKRLSSNLYAKDEVVWLKKTKFNQAITEPILNRLDPFKNNKKKKLMFSLKTKYDALKDIRKWMDEGHIVLFNLSTLSKFDIKVVIGYISTQYYITALQRPNNSLVHLLKVEESHDVQMSIFPKMCAKTRKSGLSLWLITQMLEQFASDYLEQLIGNINTLISFKQKTKAAMELQRRIPSQDIDKDDLMQIGERVGYLSVEDSGKEISFLINVKPPYRYTNGIEVDYENSKEVELNEKKNREFGRALMARDYMKADDVEKIVFSKQFKQEEDLQLEEELIVAGDSKLSVDNSNSLEKERVMWDE